MGKLKDKAKKRILNPEDPYFLGNFNTKLDTKEEKGFQEFLKKGSKELGRDLSMDLQTYDVRGFYKAGNKIKKGQHGPDTFKKPNHPTFSNESIYHGTPSPTGGKFEGGRWLEQGGPVNARNADMGLHDKTQRTGKANRSWVYKPSKAMFKMTHTEKEMKKYFDESEDAKLVLPRKKK